MSFLRSLRNAAQAQSLVKVEFDSGNAEVGFVVYADMDTFDMYVMDNVYSQSILDEDMNGGIMLESAEDIDDIDFIFVKGTYKTDAIETLVSDIAHKFPIEKTVFFSSISKSIYDNLKSSKKSSKDNNDNIKKEIKSKKNQGKEKIEIIKFEE